MWEILPHPGMQEYESTFGIHYGVVHLVRQRFETEDQDTRYQRLLNILLPIRDVLSHSL